MKHSLYILFILLAGYSCTKEIDVELDESDRKVVIESWFTTEPKEHEIKISLSSNYFENEPAPKVSGAIVEISGGGQTFPFYEIEPGLYRSLPDAHASYKTNYTLRVTYEGVTYEARDYCDTVPTINEMVVYPEYDDQNNIEGYALLIWTQELAGFGDYYAWRVLVNDTYTSDTLTDIQFAGDEFIGDGLVFEAWPIEYVSANKVTSGDSVTLEQHNLSKQAFDAYIGIMLETEWRGGIFDTPPANVPTNFNNGAFGLFVVSSMNKVTRVIP